MRNKIRNFMLSLLLIASAGTYAQIPVTDGINVAQSIVNSIQELVQTSTTANNMISNFKETVKLYNQGKEYYDGLRAISGLVKDGIKVQKTVLMVGEITEMYVNSFDKMLSDKNYSAAELTAIASGYAILLKEGSDALAELKGVVNVNGLSMSDSERMSIIDKCYETVLKYRNLTSYYTRKNISVSFVRARKNNEMDRVLGLYGNSNDRYW